MKILIMNGLAELQKPTLMGRAQEELYIKLDFDSRKFLIEWF